MGEEEKKATKTPMPKRCAIERSRFLDKAEAMTLQFLPFVPTGEQDPNAAPVKPIGTLPCTVKLFKTRSFGFYAHGKIHITVDGQPIAVQVSMSATVVNSKEAKD